ncbi:MAG: DUF418 domain-containing protein [Bacteroidales bacterium]|jgi:uncharacterized protein
MENPGIIRKPRIQVVDALRGFALFGILMLHAIEHFELYRFPETESSFLSWTDPAIFKAMFFLFGGKAYSMFSIMFGFSFFIQMENHAKRGIDFRMRFLWRLAILFVIGYLHSLMYQGDVLTVFAILGLPLVLMYRLKNKMLIWITVLLLVQIPTLVNIVHSAVDPGFVHHQDWSIFDKSFETFATGSFSEVIRFNSHMGHLAKWTFMYNTGRYLQMIGLFIIGLLLGRYRFFEDIENKRKLIVRICITSIVGFSVLYMIKVLIPEFSFDKTLRDLIISLMSSWSNLFFTAFLMSAFILLYIRSGNKHRFDLLTFYGRMSLSSYVLQPLIGVLFFYGYGFGMYRYLGVTLSLCYGILFFVFQLQFCKYWFRFFYYGPLEWIWRAVTFFDFGIPMRKQVSDKAR